MERDRAVACLIEVIHRALVYQSSLLKSVHSPLACLVVIATVGLGVSEFDFRIFVKLLISQIGDDCIHAFFI